MFKEFSNEIISHANDAFAQKNNLFIVDLSGDDMWDAYLNAFPPGTNELYRERREYDCSCCRQFIRAIGNVVAINSDWTVTSIWDLQQTSNMFAVVAKTLSDLVHSRPIKDVFFANQTKFGVERNYEQRENGEVHTWHHFNLELPKIILARSGKSPEAMTGRYRDARNVLKRSLTEISRDSIETVLDLISQDLLYRGDQWKAALSEFLSYHDSFYQLDEDQQSLFCWSAAGALPESISKIRNHSIGTMITDLSDGMDVDQAVKRYENVVAPHNYQRPKAIFTKKMVEGAEKTVLELGLINSIPRRFAVMEDLTVNNVLFANRDVVKPSGQLSAFDLLKSDVDFINSELFATAPEMDARQFISDVLPTAESVEVLFENRHKQNLVSLIAPSNVDTPTLFKWDNGFSWAYSGNITDSAMKQRVKEFGGDMAGVLRFSIQWNEENNNRNDFDAHCLEPNNNLIHYPKAGKVQPSSGVLDVDIIEPGSKPAVENITWPDITKMPSGKYQFYVHNYSHRGGRSGFRAEVEFSGKSFSYDYPHDVQNNAKVPVATVTLNDSMEFEIEHHITPSSAPKTLWSVSTNKFHPVSLVTPSPNYWDEQCGIGHQHLFFIMQDCVNDEQPNGFFNEYLRTDLIEHKRVFEALGGKMKVAPSDRQLSGLGFSLTRRSDVIVKMVRNNNSQIIKVNF